jgi:hypothetical protein
MQIQYARKREWLLWVAMAGITGCSASTGNNGSAPLAMTQTPAIRTDPGGPLKPLFGPVPYKTGAQLWSENCTRCHYVHQPDQYSGVQWQLVVAHMRQRTDLTGLEQRRIVEFLKAGSGAAAE